MTSLPGQPLDIPLPPEFSEAIGYRHDARFVGFYYIPDADDLIFDDGRSSGTAATWAFQSYRRHKAVGHLLDGTGIDEYPPTHWLLIDREANRASIVPVTEAREFLRGQYPPEPPISPEEREAAARRFDEMMATGWREEKVDPAEVMRAMTEQRGRVGRMMSWLDMGPVPPEQRKTP